jgi:CTP synthase
MYCNLQDSNHVIPVPDCQSIYEVPIILANESVDILTCLKLGIEISNVNLSVWQDMVDNIYEDLPTINIAIVGKYTEITNSYISVSEAIKHASYKNKYRAKITIISSEDLEVVGAKEMLKDYDGVIVGGGFGKSGINGKILTAQYCRENKIPYLGLSLGMELAIVEFARNVIGLQNAHSTEFNENTPCPVIHKINQNMRLGNYNVKFIDGTLARRLYGRPQMQERHRNSYEFNNDYKEKFENAGMIFSGINEDNNLVETIEYIDHPFFMGTMYQPEFISRPYRPHPVFVGFITGVISAMKKSKF